ncbi:hypothetical protein E4U21_003772 [Claviceps maximensis]|nr:hypothetical protein E4U21_003772 [Claviceps maximensis]
MEQSLTRARKEGLFTDCVIVCNDTYFVAHKVVLCAQSPVFKAAFEDPVIMELYTIDDFSPLVVKSMIDYFYEGEYSKWAYRPIKDYTEYPDDYFPFFEGMYAIGNKYRIRGLAKICKARYFEYLKGCSSESEVFASFARIYTADVERRSLLHGIHDDKTWLQIRSSFPVSTPELWKLIDECPEFSKALLKAIYKDTSRLLD